MDELFGSSETDECREALAQLYHYLDGHLTVERRVTIQTHIELCSPCLRAFSFEAELRQLVAHRCTDEVPDTLRLRIAQVIREEITVVEAAPDEGHQP